MLETEVPDPQSNLLAADLDTMEQEIRQKEAAVGYQFRDRGTPPPYIERALGKDYPESLEDIWPRVRGAIEVFRFVTRQKRPDITLGEGLPQEWSSSAREHIVNDIQHLQVLQIALSPGPLAIAGSFGRLDTLALVGEPPVPTNQNLVFYGNTWLQTALKHMQISEPLAGGLLIDDRS